MVQLQVHLRRRLLHVLDMRGRVIQQPFTLAQIIPKRRNPGFRPEAGPQQPVLVQPLQPFGVADVGLAPGHVLGVAGIDQHHREPTLFQHLEDRDPVNPGALHRDRPDAAVFEPVGEPMQVGGEGAEPPHRLRVAARLDGCHMQGGTDVDRGRMVVDGRHLLFPAAGLLRFDHGTPSAAHWWRDGLRDRSIS